ncbi:hypothetical protein ACUIJN_08505 [Metabacillus halosaccharovorans]|uniref:hypothetical protein n=1 Tax=Metabacillus halosaccharovorans TaxID=930124 RepID=UPI00403D76C6
MVISEILNQHRLKEILMNIYVKGIETEDINVKELIEEIVSQILDDSISVGSRE